MLTFLGGGRGCAGALTRPSTRHLLPKNFEKTALRKRVGIFTVKMRGGHIYGNYCTCYKLFGRQFSKQPSIIPITSYKPHKYHSYTPRQPSPSCPRSTSKTQSQGAPHLAWVEVARGKGKEKRKIQSGCCCYKKKKDDRSHLGAPGQPPTTSQCHISQLAI